MDTPTQILTIKLRVRDTHASELNRQARAVNFVWNYCNETSRLAWSRDRNWLTAFDLMALAAGSSKELRLHAHTISRVCRQFAQSRDQAKRAGLRWRTKKSLGWVPFREHNVTFDGQAFVFNKICYRTMHSRPVLTAGIDLRSGSFTQDARGRWFINAVIVVNSAEVASPRVVGIDLGLKDLATLSGGEKISAPQFYRKSERALATAQRARRSKRARTIHIKATNRRKDFLHKASANLAKEYGLIVIGDVSPSELARTWMAKSVLDAGWSDFKKMISYKALMHGGRAIEVEEHHTTQTCSECGCRPASRPKGIAGLRIREWQCDDCGAVHDRDVNAARNILRLGLEALAEGAAQMRSGHMQGGKSS